ncbi:MAG: DNA-directed RNA polymerase subunit A', partial [Thermoprotei archaeon]
INEVGVPELVSKILTVPERVNSYNIEALRDAVRRGPDDPLGANYIVRPDGRRIDLSRVKDRNEVAEGLDHNYIVERHLRDGDIVLFNRQPSLHRMSIMAHVVKVLPGRTFRLNPSVCPPYNADFDGDEMNLHVPQSLEAQAEAKILMLVQQQILSPRFGGPIIGAMQDYITGAYYLTKKSTTLTRDKLEQLLVASGVSLDIIPPPAIVDGSKSLWTGKQAFSVFLPPDLNFEAKSNMTHKDCKKQDCEYDDYVFIRGGQLNSGVIDKKAIGEGQSESLLHRVVKDYGPAAGRDFIDRAFKAFLYFFDHHGFTMTLDDVLLPQDVLKSIDEMVRDAEKKVEDLIGVYEKGEMVPLPGKTLEETFEQRVMEVLSEVRGNMG